MRRGRWIALAALPVLLLAGDIFYWRLATSRLRTSFEAWALRARAAGWDVRYGAIGTGGWPAAATLRVHDLTIDGSDPGGYGTLSWGGDQVLLRVDLTRPDVLEVKPAGLRPLRLLNSPPIGISADRVSFRLTLTPDGQPRTIVIDAAAISGSIPGLGTIHAGRLNGHAELRPDARRDVAAATFLMDAEPVSLPDAMHWGLGQEIGEVAVEGVLNGPLSNGQGLAARARSWRDEGGSLEVHRLLIRWGLARVEATATIALDEDLQPMGAGTGKITGYDAALDALAANAVLTRSAAKAAKAVLSLLADTPSDDQPPEVEVPLTLQFRTLSVHQVPLARLPELEWPEH